MKNGTGVVIEFLIRTLNRKEELLFDAEEILNVSVFSLALDNTCEGYDIEARCNAALLR